ncbi:FAR1-related sequence 5-like protein [Tanacetum coccineum]
MEAHPYARRLTTDEYRLVEDWTRKNVEARNILAILKEQNKDNVSTIKDIYNAQSKIRKAKKVGETTMQNLMSLLHTQGYVHDYDTHPVTNELEALFFLHPSSFKIWRAFPHVLIIDATYKTNIYKMPFVEIVGITSTSKTFCIAFVFISEEKEKNYKWVLERLKLTLKGCMLPRVIITDRELVLIGALSYVDEQRLNKYKEMFVSAWTDQSLNFGNHTSNRAESQHAKLKFHVSKEALDLILNELLRLDDPEFDYSMCGCRLRNSCGLPCEYIPLDSVDIFWRTLNVSWSEPVKDDDIQCEDVLHGFKEKFSE